MKINPAYDPRSDDGSDRYMVVQYNIMDTAAHADECARTRQSVRNIMRKLPALTLDLGKEYLRNVLVTEKLHRPRLDHREKT
eukprot:4027015-Pyramimonas_sp.AAC.1